MKRIMEAYRFLNQQAHKMRTFKSFSRPKDVMDFDSLRGAKYYNGV